jgi:hypothetical protein
MAVTGGTFFAGFIYLFHAHGIFYSPILIIIAMLLHLNRADTLSAPRKGLTVFACALLVGLLFHPYSLILFFAFLCGRIVEQWKGFSSPERILQTLLALTILFAILCSRPSWHQVLPSTNVRGLLTSYRMNETAPILAVLATVFSAVTILSIEKMGLKLRISLAGAVVPCALALTAMGIPVVMLWVAVAVFKMCYLRKWSLASMIFGAALLPGIAPSGSPTYAIFALLLSVFALAEGFTAAERTLGYFDSRFAVALIFIAILMGGALRLGVKIPIVSRLAQPLIVEREKTEQLEAIINWLLASPYRNWNLQLDSVVNPIDSETLAANRAYRPPTYQDYLDAYLAARRSGPTVPQTLVVTFGGRDMKERTQVYAVGGRFAGPAMVFK